MFIKTIWEMKAKGIITGIIVAAILCSCEDFEIDGLLEDFGLGFNTTYYEVEMAIPPAPAGLELSLESMMNFDLEEQLAANGYDNVTVNSINIVDATLEVAEGSNAMTLNAIDHVAAEISTESLPKEDLASVQNQLADATVLPLETTDADLSGYLSTEEYLLTTTGMLKEDLTDTLKVVAKFRYRVSVIVSSLE